MIWAICVLIEVSKYLDIVTLDVFNNDGASYIFLVCKLILRLPLVLRILVVLT